MRHIIGPCRRLGAQPVDNSCTWIPAIDERDETEARLLNWGRWVRGGLPGVVVPLYGDRSEMTVIEPDAEHVEQVLCGLRQGTKRERFYAKFVEFQYYRYSTYIAMVDWYRREHGGSETSYKRAKRAMLSFMAWKLR